VPRLVDNLDTANSSDLFSQTLVWGSGILPFGKASFVGAMSAIVEGFFDESGFVGRALSIGQVCLVSYSDALQALAELESTFTQLTHTTLFSVISRPRAAIQSA
jgi:hypothetical protein